MQLIIIAVTKKRIEYGYSIYMINIYKVILLFLLLLPSFAYANGGSPILLFISFSVFMTGQVWILFSETLFLSKISSLDFKKAFKLVFSANVVSTIIVGIGFPILLASIFILLSIYADGYYLNYIASSGIYTYSMPDNNIQSLLLSLFWLSTTYFLTVYCERIFYKSYWHEIGFKPTFSLNKFVWQANLLSYSGLSIILYALWGNTLNI
ncbi:hypothetical protein ABT56_14245 [Photobacterium aquae]|uniref:Uncharacterized protein n=1 Tax=Photobacterium aquae TaxID=1195763 RepID=A0A0J1GY74_9GAMM|nr:hypothetical protein ABT56_14245 [Photobacterium aquae]